eukprot:1161403-Pelagomonas_calceolata.AAC.10
MVRTGAKPSCCPIPQYPEVTHFHGHGRTQRHNVGGNLHALFQMLDHAYARRRTTIGQSLVACSKAPLENHHLAAAFLLLKQRDYNFLSDMPKSSFDRLRKLVIELVSANGCSSDGFLGGVRVDSCWVTTLAGCTGRPT